RNQERWHEGQRYKGSPRRRRKAAATSAIGPLRRMLGGVDFDGAKDEVLKGGDEGRGIAYGGHHAEALDAPLFCVGATIDVDFVEGFDVFGDEGNGDDHGFFYAVVAQFFQRAEEGGFEPFGRADFALVAELVNLRPVGKAPRALFAHEANGFVDVLGIGIALFDEAHGKAVGTEEEMNPGGIGKLAKTLADVGDEGLDVERMIVEIFDGAFG